METKTVTRRALRLLHHAALLVITLIQLALAYVGYKLTNVWLLSIIPAVVKAGWVMFGMFSAVSVYLLATITAPVVSWAVKKKRRARKMSPPSGTVDASDHGGMNIGHDDNTV